jgi:hypothetical protein
MKRIGVFTSFDQNNPPAPMTGCWKVFNNLKMGLEQLNIDFSVNVAGDVNGCLDGESLNDNLPEKTLVGPEIMVLPTEMPDLWGKWKYWTQPSQWVIDYMRQFDETRENDMFVWPVGVDTERFNSQGRGAFEYDCFIYYKNVTKQTPESKLRFIENELKQRGLKYLTFSYGSYGEDALMNATKKCRFGIFVTGTESQGLAVMEVMSSGVPIYIFDEKTFLYGEYTFSNENVSSCPFFDTSCGVKSKDSTFATFDKEFLPNVGKFKPREFVVNNHSLRHGAQRYVDILTHVFNR